MSIATDWYEQPVHKLPVRERNRIKRELEEEGLTPVIQLMNDNPSKTVNHLIKAYRNVSCHEYREGDQLPTVLRGHGFEADRRLERNQMLALKCREAPGEKIVVRVLPVGADEKRLRDTARHLSAKINKGIVKAWQPAGMYESDSFLPDDNPNVCIVWARLKPEDERHGQSE